MGCFGKVTIVPTPIGNLGDITSRAKEALQGCDVVFCEDTRVTGKLLSCYQISKPLKRMDENTIDLKLDELENLCKSSKHICYCSDAGMPGISDPGAKIVSFCRDRKIDVEVLPGASAFLVALVASGFAFNSFLFEGFLPKKKEARVTRLSELFNLSCPFVLYESPKRIVKLLSEICELDDEREVCIAREITKLHEEILVDVAGNILKDFKSRDTVKGEFVVVVNSGDKNADPKNSDDKIKLAKEYARLAFSRDVSSKDVRDDLTYFFDVSRNDAYEISIDH